ncbi:hypothetical protein ACER0A_013060 [Haloimpatiens sp. FM7315]|uniref:hypothetical protein n=1 Tax=Haloimpatiens sp. FM7315 TaxID=3298609 RepID=UPI003977DB30
MSIQKRNAVLIVLTYLFTTLITKSIDSTFRMASYNPLVEGFNIKLLISFLIWITIYLIIYFVLSRFVFKDKTKKEN